MNVFLDYIWLYNINMLPVMNKIKCEVCLGFGMESGYITIHEEPCTSCNGKGFFDTPEDAVDHSIEAATYTTPNWRKVSKEIVKFQTIRIKNGF